MPGGRPRYIEPTSEEECIELGEELLLWATEKTKEKRTSLGFWYSLEKGLLRDQWKALIKRPEFRPYYESAQLAIAKKLHNDELEKGLAHRYIRRYDRDLAEDEDADADAEAKRKNMTPEDAQVLLKVIDYARKNGHVESDA